MNITNIRVKSSQIWEYVIFTREFCSNVSQETATKIDESNSIIFAATNSPLPASSSLAVPDNAGDLDRRFDLMVPEKKIGSCHIHRMKGQVSSNIYEKSGKWMNDVHLIFGHSTLKTSTPVTFTPRVYLTTLQLPHRKDSNKHQPIPR